MLGRRRSACSPAIGSPPARILVQQRRNCKLQQPWGGCGAFLLSPRPPFMCSRRLWLIALGGRGAIKTPPRGGLLFCDIAFPADTDRSMFIKCRELP